MMHGRKSPAATRSRIRWFRATAATVLALALAACAADSRALLKRWEVDSGTVVIRRDNWGVPHIYAGDDYGVYYGYGYAMAEDRLYQLEIMKRSTQGTVAEWLGPDHVAFDRSQRTAFRPADIEAQFRALPVHRQHIFEGIADGINARIGDVMARPATLLPEEFATVGADPSRWKAYDVVMLFVGSMLLRYGDFNTELDNASFLAALTRQHGADTARRIFDAVNPLDSDRAPTTIPEADWPGLARDREPAAAPPPGWQPGPSDEAVQPRQGFSNILVLGPLHLDGARTLLVNGPQFGWYVPAYTYSAGFHTPDWEAVGNAPLGFPLPMFGHNGRLAWGSTWSAGDNVDLFAETLNPDDPEQYRYNGRWRSFETRRERIRVSGSEDVVFVARHSVHGPIIRHDPESGYAHARRRGWSGREMATLLSWIDATRARDHRQWLDAVYKSALNVNWYYADREGNIAYLAGGAYPRRKKDHDNRLPASGEGGSEWQGLAPATANPQVFNPSSDYIANWNNSPGKGAVQPDEWWYSWQEADRIHILDAAVQALSPMTPDGAWDLMMQASYVDPNVRFFRDPMLVALADAETPRKRRISELLKAWDGTFSDRSGVGSHPSDGTAYLHPAVALFRTWLAEMLYLVLGDDLPGPVGHRLANDTGYGTPGRPTAAGLNIAVGLKLLNEALNGRTDHDFLNGRPAVALWRDALDRCLTKLEETFGPRPEDWRLPVPPTRFGHRNFLGIPQTGAERARDDAAEMNRGTENNMVVFGEDGSVLAYEIVPPGQSGHVGPDGVPSPHYYDQFELYRRHGRKPVLFEEEEVRAAERRVQVLSLPPR